MAAADQGSKWLIGASPEAWAQWALNDPARGELVAGAASR
jgi:hypothetical protein